MPRRICCSSTSMRSVSPGLTWRLKRTLSIPAKSASLSRYSSSREDGDAADLSHRLDDEHARHHRVAGEVALEEGLVDRHLLDADGAVRWRRAR